MRNKFLLAACAAAFASTAAFAGPFDGFKGKMKPGLYESKMEMDMPGMPKGMGNMTHQHCITQTDIDSGQAAKGPQSKGQQDCEVKDMKMSGNTASYKVECKGGTKVDTKMTFSDNGYQAENKMVMNQGGQVMNVTQKIDSRYIGPCKQ